VRGAEYLRLDALIALSWVTGRILKIELAENELPIEESILPTLVWFVAHDSAHIKLPDRNSSHRLRTVASIMTDIDQGNPLLLSIKPGGRWHYPLGGDLEVRTPSRYAALLLDAVANFRNSYFTAFGMKPPLDNICHRNNASYTGPYHSISAEHTALADERAGRRR
jgi:hypothetical protein